MQKFVRYLVLALLSGITAEFLLGDQWLHGIPPTSQQIFELVLFTIYYGSAAVLIREITRRTGRGWPTILLLAFAFGVIEEGILDQTLFNPDYLGNHLLAYGFIPGLAIGGPWTIYVLTLHVIWSMGAPIAIAEALFPGAVRSRGHGRAGIAVGGQVQAPWLGKVGLGVATALYLLGALGVFGITLISTGYAAPWWQLVLAALVAAVSIVVALRLPKRVARPRSNPWVAGAIGLVVTSAFQLVNYYVEKVASPWISALLLLVILTGGVVLAARLRLDVFGLAAGAVLTYSWLGLTKAIALGAFPAIEQGVLVLAELAVLASVLLIRRRAELRGSSPARRADRVGTFTIN